jgi:hypothetical protein
LPLRGSCLLAHKYLRLDRFIETGQLYLSTLPVWFIEEKPWPVSMPVSILRRTEAQWFIISLLISQPN